MWYVLQKIGNISEDTVCEKCRRAIPQDIASGIFIPRYIALKRLQGRWEQVTKPLFPGYIFIESEVPEGLKTYLDQLSGVIQPVGVGDAFIPLYAQEQRFFEALWGAQRILGLSKGEIVDGRCVVYEGPLKGYADHIRRINRHHRVADIAVHLCGEERLMRAGLEVTGRSGDALK